MAATTQRRLRRAQPADGLADHEIMARHALERLDGAVSRGWVGEKTHPDIPYITNLRLDPFERTGWPNNGTKEGAQQYFDWFKFQFWRFVFVQQVVGNELQTFLNFPPMQKGAPTEETRVAVWRLAGPLLEHVIFVPGRSRALRVVD